MMQTTSAKAWAALITAAVGVAALYGVHVTLPSDTVLTDLLDVALPLATAGVTWLIPNKTKV